MFRSGALLLCVLIVGLGGASGCVKRMPAPDVSTDCRSARAFLVEQVAGACAPEPDLKAASELFERCDDATLAQARQHLLEKGGLADVQVLRGPRQPGTNRHALIVRYASSEAGTCPARPSTGPLFCEDCRIGRTFMTWGPLPCGSPRGLFKKLQDEARIDGCQTEQLDAARERLWETGWFKQVEVSCNKTEDRVAMAFVDAEFQDPEEMCSRLVPGYGSQPRCAHVKPKPQCPDRPVCHKDFNGCEVCSCSSSLEKLLGELRYLPLLFQ